MNFIFNMRDVGILFDFLLVHRFTSDYYSKEKLPTNVSLLRLWNKKPTRILPIVGSNERNPVYHPELILKENNPTSVKILEVNQNPATPYEGT